MSLNSSLRTNMYQNGICKCAMCHTPFLAIPELQGACSANLRGAYKLILPSMAFMEDKVQHQAQEGEISTVVIAGHKVLNLDGTHPQDGHQHWPCSRSQRFGQPYLQLHI